jgi:Methyltransferase domain
MSSDAVWPKFAPKIPQVHLDNCRLLSTREDILSLLPKDIVFCEIGVALGEYTERVLSICSVKKFYALDLFVLHSAPNMWGGRVGRELNGRDHTVYYREKFRTFIDNDVLEIVPGDSVAGLEKVPENFVDVFYVDSDHGYPHVKKELGVIKKIMKQSSIIIMNDYIMEDWVTRTPYGVVQAANEFIIENDMEMLFFALSTGMYCDIAIRKRGVQ